MRRSGAAAIGLLLVLLASWLLWPGSTEAPAPPPNRPEAPTKVKRPNLRPPPSPAPEPEAPAEPVECELATGTYGGLDGVRVEEFDPDSLEPIGMIQATITDRRWIRFTPRHAVGQGRIWVAANQPVIAGWLDGACLDLVDPKPWPRTPVRVRVENAELFDEVLVVYQQEGFPVTAGFRLHATQEGTLQLMIGSAAKVRAVAEADDEPYQDEVAFRVEEGGVVTLTLDPPD